MRTQYTKMSLNMCMLEFLDKKDEKNTSSENYSENKFNHNSKCVFCTCVQNTKSTCACFK